MVDDPFVDLGVMGILAALKRRVVVYLDDAGIAVVVLDIYAIQAVSDRICRIDPD